MDNEEQNNNNNNNDIIRAVIALVMIVITALLVSQGKASIEAFMIVISGVSVYYLGKISNNGKLLG